MRLNWSFLFILLGFSTAEIQEMNTLNSTFIIETKTQNFINPSDFKFQSLNKFDLKDWYYVHRQEKLKKLTKAEITKYFQDTELTGDPAGNEDNWYYFSIHRSTQEIKQITIIEEYDQCCADLLLMTFDQYNKLISKNVVAGTGGDGEWSYNEYGEFDTDSTYILTRVEKVQIGEYPSDEIYQVDSSITKFSIIENLSFNTIDKKTFQYSIK
jgi:hypothetical protein